MLKLFLAAIFSSSFGSSFFLHQVSIRSLIFTPFLFSSILFLSLVLLTNIVMWHFNLNKSEIIKLEEGIMELVGWKKIKILPHIPNLFPHHLPKSSKSPKHSDHQYHSFYSPKPPLLKKFLLIFILLCSIGKVQMDCNSRFSFKDHNCILTSSSQLKCWGLE